MTDFHFPPSYNAAHRTNRQKYFSTAHWLQKIDLIQFDLRERGFTVKWMLVLKWIQRYIWGDKNVITTQCQIMYCSCAASGCVVGCMWEYQYVSASTVCPCALYTCVSVRWPTVCYSRKTSFNCVCFSLKEPEHHCGPGLVSGSTEAYPHQRRTDPEC